MRAVRFSSTEDTKELDFPLYINKQTRRPIHIQQQIERNPPSFLIQCFFSNVANTPLLEMKGHHQCSSTCNKM